MTNEEQNNLIELLGKWADEYKQNPPEYKNYWNQNKTANFIKNKIKEIGHWKNKSGGRKGNIEILKKAKAKRDDKMKQKQLEKEKSLNLDF